MHDIDRTQPEWQQGVAFQDEHEGGEFLEVPRHGSQELASELLDVANEEERRRGYYSPGAYQRSRDYRQRAYWPPSYGPSHARRAPYDQPLLYPDATFRADDFYLNEREPWHWEYSPRGRFGLEREATNGGMSFETGILERMRRLFGSIVGVGEATLAFTGGERDENRLTDVLFYTRHPEHRGRRIQQSERQLAREWMAIRELIIRPVLRNLQAPRSSASFEPLVAAPAPLPADSPSASQFTRKVPERQRFAALIPLLDRARGNIPLDFLLGWIDVESNGRLDVITPLGERGFFQIHPAESKDHHLQHKRLTTDPDYSVHAGIQIVCAYADLARQRYPWIPFGSELFWRIVKLQHAMGSALTQRMLSDMRNRGLPPTSWDAIKAYELTDSAKRLHALLRQEPGRFARNVDAVFARGRQIAKSLGR
jgi:hypothetical protein